MTSASPAMPADSTKRSGIYQTLLYSHMTVAAILLVLLIPTVLANFALRSKAMELTLRDAPSMEAAMTCRVGLERSLAALRGWILLGDPEFKGMRAGAWEEMIRPAIRRLTQFSGSWEAGPAREHLFSLEPVLEDLYEIQWWIEDIAQSPGNEPAKFIYLQNAKPLAESIRSSITAMINAERDEPATAQRKELLENFADFRGSFAFANGELSEIVAAGGDRRKAAFEEGMAAAEAQLAKLESARAMLVPEQRALVDSLVYGVQAYRAVAGRCVDARLSPSWNHAQWALAEEAVVIARRADSLLTDVVEARSDRMYETGGTANMIGNVTIGLAALFVYCAATSAWLLSRQRAVSIARPILQLAIAARKVANGGLDEDVPEEGPSEVRHLSGSFNWMRRALRRRESELKSSEAKYRRLAEELDELSHLDGLTGIPNRRAYDKILSEEWQRAQRAGNMIGLLLIDVDHFKQFNDYYGHQAGDRCLQQVAAAMIDRLLRASDKIARYGGEEFAAILPDTSPSDLENVAEMLRRAVESLAIPHERSQTSGAVTISVGGVAGRPTVGTEAGEYLARADAALYDAKSAGRNAVKLQACESVS